MPISILRKYSSENDQFLFDLVQKLGKKLDLAFESEPFDQTRTRLNQEKTILLISEITSDPRYHLDLIDFSQNKKGLKLNLSFDQGPLLYKISNNRTSHNSLVKAMGMKAGNTNPQCAIRIIDACAGFARDGISLAATGAEVTMLEINPVVFSLTQNAIERASANQQLENNLKQLFNQISYLNRDCIEYFKEINREDNIDVIYLDPMFPAKPGSAKVKKESQFLQLLSDQFGAMHSTQELLDAALQTPVKRVVLKRPSYAALSDKPKPHGIINGKTTRYEIFSVLDQV